MPERFLLMPPSWQMKPHGFASSRNFAPLRPVWPAVTSTLRCSSSGSAQTIES